MDNFIPDIYAQSIYTINYQKLDNTLVPYKETEPTQKVKDLFAVLTNDFKVIIMSNSTKNRLRPFKEKLNVDTAYSSRKPFKKKYKRIIELYRFKEDEVACIGDQLLTDILGANRMGFTSIFVNRLAPFETIPTRINRSFEKIILNKLKKQKLLVKGEYYD